MFSYKITVFTATYNRAHTLERLYNSLQKQTFLDFEWLVIDDGSIDNTNELLEKWIKETNAFPIRYYKKENGGKHTAINFGLDKAKGELFFTADSDDYLIPDALEKVCRWRNSLPNNEKFCAVVGNLGHSPTDTPNAIFKGEFRDANLLERYSDFSSQPVDGERAYVFFTEIHRKYKYPEFEKEKFMTEAVAWNRMGNDGYKMRVYNDIIYIYKFLPNGLTLSGGTIFIENPKGYALWLKEKAQFCNYNWLLKYKIIYSYYTTQKNRLSIYDIAKNIGTSVFLFYFYLVIFKIKRGWEKLFKNNS